MDSRNQIESVFTKKVRAGKRRTYFFDVRKTKGDDYYVTLTESTRRRDEDGYVRHKLFLYKEDFNRFLGGLTEVIDHIKTELMPDYDYEEFEKRQKEWEEQKRLELEAESNSSPEISDGAEVTTENEPAESKEDVTPKAEDDLSW